MKTNPLLIFLSALGGLTAFLIYIEGKKTRKLEREVLELDKELKAHQIYNAKLKERVNS
jgi:hypothetical protein